MAGAPSQLDLFDYKPKLAELEGKPIPPSVIMGQRYAFIQPDAAVLGPRFSFAKHGECGAEVSETMPQLANYEFAAICRQADQAGGDYFDWQEISESRVVLSLADVTGHGVGPALVTAACRAYVRASIANEFSTTSLLSRVNNLLCEDIPDGKFVTLVLVDLNARSHTYQLTSAGHGPTLIVRAAEEKVEQLDSQGLPLGLFGDQDMDQPIVVTLEPGDAIVAVSDGFFEWSNASGEAFGIERLEAVARAHRHMAANDMLVAMEKTVREFVGELHQQDDVTGLVIRR